MMCRAGSVPWQPTGPAERPMSSGGLGSEFASQVPVTACAQAHPSTKDVARHVHLVSMASCVHSKDLYGQLKAQVGCRDSIAQRPSGLSLEHAREAQTCICRRLTLSC